MKVAIKLPSTRETFVGEAITVSAEVLASYQSIVLRDVGRDASNSSSCPTFVFLAVWRSIAQAAAAFLDDGFLTRVVQTSESFECIRPVHGRLGHVTLTIGTKCLLEVRSKLGTVAKCFEEHLWDRLLRRGIPPLASRSDWRSGDKPTFISATMRRP